MSNIPSGGRGVSTAQLVVFILVILASGVMAYVFYSEADKVHTQIEIEREKLQAEIKNRDKHVKALKDLYDAIGIHGKNEIAQTFAASPIKIPMGTTRLEDLVDAYVDNVTRHNQLLGLDLQEVDAYQEGDPIDGAIDSYDATTGTGSIDLGSDGGIKVGYVLDVYAAAPGPEGPKSKDLLGQLRVVTVAAGTSQFEAIPEEPVEVSAETPETEKKMPKFASGNFVRFWFYRSKFLDETLVALFKNTEVPAELVDTQAGKLLAEKIRLDKAMAERDTIQTDGERDLTNEIAKIRLNQAEQNRERARLDGEITTARAAYIVERDKFRDEPPLWKAEGDALQARLDIETAITRRLEEKKKVQQDETSPIDGVILSYDWKTRTGTVNLGARERVKAGYEFDVYTTRPGPEGPEKRIMLGRIKLFTVRPETSLFKALESPHESPMRPIMAGHAVRSKLYDRRDRKVFVLKGWFPAGGDYSKASLAGLIFKNGGIVDDDLTLDTDYLVMGVYDEKGVPNPSAAAKLAIAEGAAAYKQADHSGTATILSVQKLLKYLDRKGLQAAR